MNSKVYYIFNNFHKKMGKKGKKEDYSQKDAYKVEEDA
jgi:hypothetical protein